MEPTQPSEGERAPRPGELAREGDLFRTGSAAEHRYAVLYQGEHETAHDGTAVAVRAHARALADTGVPLLLRSFSNIVVNERGVPEPVHAVGLPESVNEEVGDLRMTSCSTLTPLIKHLVVSAPALLGSLLVPRGVVDADPARQLALRAGVYEATIAYTVWERDRIDASVAQHLSRVSQCWVPCEQNADLLRRAGVTRVHVVPHPYRPDSPVLALTRRRPWRHRRFYSIGRWEPRKGLDALLGAFLRAFKPEDQVRLTIKYSGSGRWSDYPTPEQSVDQWLREFPDWGAEHVCHTPDPNQDPENPKAPVQLLGGIVSRPRILKLHFAHNIYVSASHGEAWNLPAFEAKLAGNRMVHVPYGGTVDFDDDDDVRVGWYDGPVHPSYDWGDAEWAHYDLAALTAALQRVEAPGWYGRRPLLEQHFSAAAVGAQMLELVLEVADKCNPKAAAYLRSCADQT